MQSVGKTWIFFHVRDGGAYSKQPALIS